MGDDFSFNVHPFRFASASGLTPHLRYLGGPKPPAGTGRNRLRGQGEQMPHSSFGGKSGDSRVWLTPRTTTALKREKSAYASGSLTERSARPPDSGPLIPTTREAGRKKVLRSQAVQGMTWRFLKQGAPAAEASRRGTASTEGGRGGGGGSMSARGAAGGGGGGYDPKVKGADPLEGLDEGYFGMAEHERAFESLLGGGVSVQDKYAKFEAAVKKRVKTVTEGEVRKRDTLKQMGRDAKMIYDSMHVDEDEEGDQAGMSSSSSEDQGEEEQGEEGMMQGRGGQQQQQQPLSMGRREIMQPEPEVVAAFVRPRARESLIDISDMMGPGDAPGGSGGAAGEGAGSMRGPPPGVSKLYLPSGYMGDPGMDTYGSIGGVQDLNDPPLSTGRRGTYNRIRRGGVGTSTSDYIGQSSPSKGDEEGSDNAEEDEEDEEDDGLANPQTAPCIIWHTPLRVKIAANLPQELRDELATDSTFVRDDRVVPDIWDHKFLPVSRRSVAAPMPANTPRARSLKYGSWYMPVDDWGKTHKGKDAGGGGKDEDDLPSLMDKMEREIVKLSSSKMFYQYIKAEKLRVPHYLRKMEDKGAPPTD